LFCISDFVRLPVVTHVILYLPFMKLFFYCLLVLSLFFYSTDLLAQKRDRRAGMYSAYLYFVETPFDHNLDSLQSTYEDDLIDINWNYTGTQFEFDLRNKSNQSIKILWDDAAFISLSGESSRVFHRGIKYVEREKSQPPTSVYKNASISDLVAPTSYTRFVSGQLGVQDGWKTDPLIPVKQGVMASKIEYLPQFIGRTMRVVLPIRVEDKTIEYIFSFKTDFIEKKKGAKSSINDNAYN